MGVSQSSEGGRVIYTYDEKGGEREANSISNNNETESFIFSHLYPVAFWLKILYNINLCN